MTSRLDDVDAEALGDLGGAAFGADPDGWWPTSRRHALARLRHAVTEVLPRFGPHEDAMLTDSPQMAHTLLSAPLNIGLLLPGEVADAAEEAYRAGDVPLASAEGFIRQVIGWREYVWGVYWLWMPDYRGVNDLGADSPLPPSFTTAETDMACLRGTLRGVHQHGWVHHIQRVTTSVNRTGSPGGSPRLRLGEGPCLLGSPRLSARLPMVLANLCTLLGVEPRQVVRWMAAGWPPSPTCPAAPTSTG